MNKIYVVFFFMCMLITAARATVSEGLQGDFAVACALWADGEYAQAAETFENVRDSSPVESEKAAFSYALALEKAGDSNAAQEGLGYFINNYPDSEYYTMAKKMLVNSLVSSGEYAKAQLLLHQFMTVGDMINDEEQQLSLQIFCYLSLVQYSNVNYKIYEFINKYPDSSMGAYYKQWQAWYSVELIDYNKAEDIYTEIVSTNSDKMVVARAKARLVELLLYNKDTDRAVGYMLELTKEQYRYHNVQLLWLAEYLRDIRELEVATEVLQVVIAEPESVMHKAVALHDLAKTQTENRNFHDALSLFPLVQKELMSADYKVGKIELLEKLSAFSNALALRRVGNIAGAHAMLSELETNIEEPLYYELMYEQGLVAFSLGAIEDAAKKLMQVGVLSSDPDLAGRALLKCYEACTLMNRSQLMRVCLEELSGKNEGSYGKLYPNSPYAAQAFDILKEQ